MQLDKAVIRRGKILTEGDHQIRETIGIKKRNKHTSHKSQI